MKNIYWCVADLGGSWLMRNAKTENEAKKTILEWLTTGTSFRAPLCFDQIQVLLISDADMALSTNDKFKNGKPLSFSIDKASVKFFGGGAK